MPTRSHALPPPGSLLERLARIVDWFLPSQDGLQLQALDELRRGRILVWGAFGAAAMLATIVAARALVLNGAGKLWWLYVLGVVVLAATPLVMQRTRSLRVAGTLPPLMAALCLPIAAFVNGGPAAPAVGMMPAVALLAVAFSPPRVARVLTLLLMVEGLALLALYDAGVHFERELSEVQRVRVSLVVTLVTSLGTAGLGYLLEVQRQLVESRLEEARAALYEASTRDALTTAHNRRYFDECMLAELAYASRHATDLAIIVADIDHFKRVNDTHGHAAGDAVLRELVQRFRGTLRQEDLLARYGGEEFVIGLRGVGIEGARAAAERLRAVVDQEPFRAGEHALRCTSSFGCAALDVRAPGGATLEELLRVADRRLYAAKSAGRDRVVFTD